MFFDYRVINIYISFETVIITCPNPESKPRRIRLTNFQQSYQCSKLSYRKLNKNESLLQPHHYIHFSRGKGNTISKSHSINNNIKRYTVKMKLGIWPIKGSETKPVKITLCILHLPFSPSAGIFHTLSTV